MGDAHKRIIYRFVANRPMYTDYAGASASPLGLSRWSITPGSASIATVFVSPDRTIPVVAVS